MADKRLAIVTGGARGIGRAIVLRLLAQGRKVAALDINDATLAELKDLAGKQGYNDGELLTAKIDITNSAALSELIEKLAEAHGGIGILVNNAGITRDKLMIQMEDEDFDRVVNINLRAAFVAARVAARSMLRNKFGRIVNIASVAGVMGQRGSANYAASKAGMIGFAKSLAREVGKKGVTVNCVAPGFIMTDMTAVLHEQVKAAALATIPVEKFGTPEDVANAVAFLAADESGYITGQVLCVDGGMAM